MIKVCLFEFETKEEGILKMQNFESPCAFIVENKIFDYLGNPLTINDEYYVAPIKAMDLVIGFGDENTVEGYSYVQDNICKVNLLS